MLPCRPAAMMASRAFEHCDVLGVSQPPGQGGRPRELSLARGVRGDATRAPRREGLRLPSSSARRRKPPELGRVPRVTITHNGLSLP